MATRGAWMYITYVAWDTVNNAPKVGDASNHTLRWIKDGTAYVPQYSPSEVNPTYCPGVYRLYLTNTETSCDIGTLSGKSSTSGVVIIPVTIQFERLPNAAPGQTGGLPIIGSSPLTNLDASVSSRLASSDSRLNNLDASVSSRLAAANYTPPDNTSIAAIKAKTDKLTFNESNAVYAYGSGGGGASPEEIWTYSNRSLTDKSGFSLTSDYDAAKTAASQTTADAIKTQTDKLQFTAQNLVRADVGEVEIAPEALAAVWDVTLAEHTTAGTTGKALSDAATAAHKIGTGTKITVVSPIDPETLHITLVRGDDYNAADGRALEWSSGDWPNLTNATVVFTAVPTRQALSSKWTKTATVLNPGQTTQTVQVELTSTQTSFLSVGKDTYRYDIEATWPNGRRITLVLGRITVLADMTWHSTQ